MIMSILNGLTNIQLTKIKFLLLASFSFLMVSQFFIGFKSFDDYLIIFVYALFLNDLVTKLKKTERISLQNERTKRSVMSILFLILLSLPFFLDAFNVADSARLFIYRLGFILWSQIFLLDAFVNYKETRSKKWLLITNMAVLFIVMGAFVN